MFIPPLHSQIRKHREATGLSQIEFAQQLGIAAKRYSHFERGERHPGLEELELLREHLGDLRGSIPPEGVGRRLVDNAKKLRPLVPEFRPGQDRPSDVRYFAALAKYPDFVRRLTATIRRRVDFEDCQCLCGRLAIESADEVLFILRLLEAGALPASLSPQALGRLPHPILDPANGTEVSHHRFPCLAFANEFYFFQVTLATPRRYRVDVLRWSHGWSVIEIDGLGHVAAYDEARDLALGLPVTRLSPVQIMGDTFRLPRAA